MSFPTPKTGYISGRDGILMKSTDSGENWVVLTAVGLELTESTPDIIDIQFITEDLGYLIVSNQTSPTYLGELYTSIDGGQTWTAVPHWQSVAAYRVHYYNEDFGLLAGSSFFQGKAVCRNKSGDWGAFHSLSPYPIDFIRGIDIYNPQRAVICGDSGMVYTTNDSGITWLENSIMIGSSIDSSVTSIRFLDENTLIATTANGLYPAVISHDFGVTWESLPIPVTFNYPAMTAVAKSLGDSAVIVGRDVNNQSFSGYVNWWNGSEWQQEQLEYGLNDVSSRTNNSVFAVGDSGIVITNNPTQPSKIRDIEMASPFRIFPNPAHRLVMLDYDAGLKITYVSIFDLSGRLVLHFQGAQEIIDLSLLSPGNYFFKIASNKGTFTEKLLVY